ncbi:MAG: response regulator [Acidobacteriota bacterium]|jgi:PAS domain S-box-containing protein|nr:response regulator [Acidobacteriota bacterium]
MSKAASRKSGEVRKLKAGEESGKEKIRPGSGVEDCRVDEELSRYRVQLEALIGERTRELEIANRRLETEIEERRQAEIVQSALYQITKKANQAQDMEALYGALHGIISGLLFAQNFYIALADADGETISFPYFVDEFDAPPGPQRLSRGLTEYVLRGGQPLLASDQQIRQMASEGLIDLIGSPSSEWLGVPLKWGERTFGVLVVQSYQEDFHYSERDRELLIFVSQHIADALWRKQAESDLMASEHKFRSLFEESLDVIFISDRSGNLVDINQAGLKMFGYASRDEILKKNRAANIFENPGAGHNLVRTLLQDGHVKDYEINFLKRDGSPVCALVTAQMDRDASGRVTAIHGIMRDVTERKLLEERFIQAQKMESIGLLAGGIAHDFNNILGGILGYASWLKTNIDRDHPFFRPVDTIEKSANRAAELTAQLLAFARGGKYDIRPSSLNSVISESLKILAGTLDKSIVIETFLDNALPTVEIDVGQIQQVLMNLCVNARDAMPDGGRLTIQSSMARLCEDDVRRQPEGKPGWFAVLAVCDTGVGMGDSIKKRIFEPFFTTKVKGKGTGLGLSMVYGVVKNHGGFVNVYSEVGRGTTFKVYLPLSGKPEVVENTCDSMLAGGHETILVIDDEEAIRDLAADILGSYGYRVHLAADGAEGVTLFAREADGIDMVLLDMVMPRLGGRETFLQLQQIDPKVRVLFSTGYSQNETVNEILALGVRGFIQKPYQVSSLLAKVRDILDAKP